MVYLGQTTLSKIDEICPMAIANQICTISMQIRSVVKIHRIYSRYHLETKITKLQTCLRLITPSKIDEICPLSVPNQISVMSMHIPNVVKIHRHLLKLSFGNEIRTDTHGRPTRYHSTPPLSCGGVKKRKTVKK